MFVFVLNSEKSVKDAMNKRSKRETCNYLRKRRKNVARKARLPRFKYKYVECCLYEVI